MTSPVPEDDWTACPAGELGRLTETMRSRRTRQKRIRAAGVAVGVGCVLLLTVAGVNWLKGTGGEMDYGGITCTEVRRQVRDYMAGRVEESTARQIQIHLAECPMCQDFMKDMGIPAAGDSAGQASRTSPHRLADADVRVRPEALRPLNSLLTDVR